MATQSIRAVPSRQYEQKKYDRNKYVVDSHQYPSDLMGLTTDQSTGYSQSNYGSNYVIFYINVNNESRMIKNPDKNVQTVDIGSNERIAKGLNGREYNQNQVVAVATAVAGFLFLVHRFEENRQFSSKSCDRQCCLRSVGRYTVHTGITVRGHPFHLRDQFQS